jgi:hypothetical protein
VPAEAGGSPRTALVLGFLGVAIGLIVLVFVAMRCA